METIPITYIIHAASMLRSYITTAIKAQALLSHRRLRNPLRPDR